VIVELTIDGKTVMTDEGATVLAAARKAGVHIPTFCHHPRLSTLGACRMCLVEVEGMGRLQTSCSLPVGEGMVVWSATPKVEKARREMLEFLLINHEFECPVCEASGECTLQDYIFRYDAAKTRFSEKARRLRDHIISPLIDRNLNRCIQCKRCVRVCEEVQGVAALGMSWRGWRTVVGPFMEKSLDCEFCSHCIWVCPVGAIGSRALTQKVRAQEMEKVEAVCPHCADGCVLHLNRRDNQVLRVSHAGGRGVNDGSLCARGYFGFDVIHHYQRLATPLVRQGGTLRPASWEDALAAAARGLADAARRAGPGSVGGIAGDRLTNEELYLFQKLFRSVLGSDNLDTASGFARRAVLPFLRGRFGAWAGPNALSEIAGADALLLVGCEVTVAAPITGLLVKRAIGRGAAVTELSFRRTPLSRLARRALAVRPGRELAVLKAMAGVMLDEGLHAGGAVPGLERLALEVRAKSPAQAAGEAGVPLAALAEAAREFARGPRSAILFGEPAALGPAGPAVLDALADLLLLTGRAGREGCGLYPVFPGANAQGALDMGAAAGILPGHADLADPAARKRLRGLWGGSLPDQPGLDAPGMLAAAARGELSALLVAGADPVATFPGGPEKTAAALGKIPFLAVSDLFLTETARLAHVVFPACSSAERAGTFTSAERRVQRTARAIDPLGGSLPDWRILSELGTVMGAPFRVSGPGEVLEEIARAVPAYEGVSLRILADNGLMWPFTAADAKGLYREGSVGALRLLPEGGAPSARFAAPPGWGDAPAPAGYPHLLVAGDILFHSGVFTRRSESLAKLASGALLLAHPAVLAEAGAEEGSLVRVASPHGELTVEARASGDLAPGTLFLPRPFANAAASRLFSPGGGDEAASTVVVPVRVESL
jgi:predicted molibdopterin-dependent oxidoreductase YjgC